MSHELRTPLIAIRGFATVVAEHERADESLLNAASHIDREAQDLLAAISNILDASKLEAGKVQLFLENVSLEPIVARCVYAGSGHRAGARIHRFRSLGACATRCSGSRRAHLLGRHENQPRPRLSARLRLIGLATLMLRTGYDRRD
jgi:signal transduction histidine kinase